MVAELNSSVERNAPLVMMFWAPHWDLFTQDYGWVEMPEDIVNEYSLQKPRVFKSAWPGMEEKWPAAWRFINTYHLNNQIQEELMGRIDNDGEDLEEVAGVDADGSITALVVLDGVLEQVAQHLLERNPKRLEDR